MKVDRRLGHTNDNLQPLSHGPNIGAEDDQTRETDRVIASSTEVMRKCRNSTLIVASALLSAVVSSAAMAQTDASASKSSAHGEVVDLRRRVEQLEQQVIDVQVILGTLQTLATGQSRTDAGAVMTYEGGNSGDQRIAALETQIRALTAQIQQLANQNGHAASGSNQLGTTQFNRRTALKPQIQSDFNPKGFGATTVRRGDEDVIGGLIQRESGGANQIASQTPQSRRGTAQEDYEVAYGLLLQQDYQAAKEALAEFIARYPGHELTGNAQYWLAETHYVRGQYKEAAAAFLKGYREYRRSAKAPDSLLKLAMSLDQLGQRAAACSSLGELQQTFPRAANHVKRRAGQERRRLQC
ncbi:MAG: tol-pal system protein YbgF [Hyphomicrobiaceae bacterium]